MDRTSLSERSRVLPRGALTHLVALDRPGMSGLAELLVAPDRAVSGSVEEASDDLAERLRVRGIQVHRGHGPTSVPHETSRLIYPEGISRLHPERLRAARLGAEQSTLVDAIREVSTVGDSIVVIGRRVARVAATMIGWVLIENDLDPTLILGSEIPDRLGQGRAGVGPFSVLDLPDSLWNEGVISERTKLALVLDVGDVTPLQRRGLAAMAEALPSSAILLGSSREPILREMAESTSARVERVSIDDQPTSDWWGADLRERDGRYRFRTFHEGRFRLEVGLSCHGRRYVEAALAAIAACHLLEIGSRPIREALEEYLGASRAFDMKGTYRGVTMIDDDAVEPSDVAETLALARMVYGGRRLWAVYAPRESSRVPVAGFESADHVLFVGAAPETADRPSFVDSSPSTSRRARVGYAADRDEAVRDLDRLLEPGDVLVTLGTSDTGTIADAFIRRLPRDRRAR